MDTINELVERLFFYLSALEDYKQDSNEERNTNYGFCHYFGSEYQIFGIYNNFSDFFPELGQFKPEYNWRGTGYWFEKGDVKSRKKCLEKAINLTIEKIENHGRE